MTLKKLISSLRQCNGYILHLYNIQISCIFLFTLGTFCPYIVFIRPLAVRRAPRYPGHVRSLGAFHFLENSIVVSWRLLS